jgi:hypothetical protein
MKKNLPALSKAFALFVLTVVFNLSPSTVFGQAQPPCEVTTGRTVNGASNGCPDLGPWLDGCTDIIISATLQLQSDWDLTQLGPVNLTVEATGFIDWMGYVAGGGDECPGGCTVAACNNHNIYLASNSVLNVNPNSDFAVLDTLTACNNNKAIYIGTVKYAGCKGAGNVIYTFADLMAYGGSARPEINTQETVCAGDDFTLSMASFGVAKFDRNIAVTKITPTGGSSTIYTTTLAAEVHLNHDITYSYASSEGATNYADTGVYTFVIGLTDNQLARLSPPVNYQIFDTVRIRVLPGPEIRFAEGGNTTPSDEYTCLVSSPTITLADHVGVIERWERKHADDDTWEIINHTDAEFTDNLAKITGLYEYRARVFAGGEACDFIYSDTTEILYNVPQEIIMADGTESCVVDVDDWIHFFTPDGKVIASVNSFGQDLGLVSAGVDLNGGDARMISGIGHCATNDQAAMNRVFTITPAAQPGSDVNVRLYFTQSELDDLIALAGCGDPAGCPDNDDVCNIGDLYVTKISGANRELFYPHDKGSSDYNSLFVEITIDGFSEFWLHGTESGYPLPVELASFRATAVNDEFIRLNWTTLTEVNNDGFEIQRSLDGINFTKIAWVEGNGTTTAKQEYVLNDKEAAKGVNYYRLKQIDYNGDFEYSNIVAAKLGALAGNLSVDVYPNPTQGDLNIVIDAEMAAENTISIYNHLGQQVRLLSERVNAGKNTIAVQTSGLPSGAYFMTVESAGKIITKKFVIASK